MWKEGMVFYSKELLRHFPGGTEDNKGNPQSGAGHLRIKDRPALSGRPPVAFSLQGGRDTLRASGRHDS
jgi:hypothetical protein